VYVPDSAAATAAGWRGRQRREDDNHATVKFYSCLSIANVVFARTRHAHRGRRVSSFIVSFWRPLRLVFVPSFFQRSSPTDRRGAGVARPVVPRLIEMRAVKKFPPRKYRKRIHNAQIIATQNILRDKENEKKTDCVWVKWNVLQAYEYILGNAFSVVAAVHCIIARSANLVKPFVERFSSDDYVANKNNMLNLMYDACLWVCCTVDPPSETVLVNDVIRLSVCLSVCLSLRLIPAHRSTTEVCRHFEFGGGNIFQHASPFQTQSIGNHT